MATGYQHLGLWVRLENFPTKGRTLQPPSPLQSSPTSTRISLENMSRILEQEKDTEPAHEVSHLTFPAGWHDLLQDLQRPKIGKERSLGICAVFARIVRMHCPE